MVLQEEDDDGDGEDDDQPVISTCQGVLPAQEPRRVTAEGTEKDELEISSGLWRQLGVF